MSNQLFDIIICVGPNDFNIINQNIDFTKKNIIGFRNIYLICSDPTINIEGTITIDETIFPFTKKTLIEMLGQDKNIGWYLQQLLKIYAGNIIQGILKNYLIIDTDCHFLKPTKFITDDGKFILTTGDEYHKEYFEHMNKLHPSLKKYHHLSGICHHCLFNNDRVNNLIKMVEDYHKKSFYTIFIEQILELIIKTGEAGSHCSEYEIYFNFMFHYFPNQIEIRSLQWKNTANLNLNCDDDFQAVHWYMRK